MRRVWRWTIGNRPGQACFEGKENLSVSYTKKGHLILDFEGIDF